jgi:Mg-chelatase subunit ChlD|tara:strand:+ start:674 stop:1264 length:591 start_codon:yes stop_codon:yes gene_type:complete
MRRKEKTHYVIVLDQSGSMEGIKKTVISSFNEQLQSLQKQSKEMDIEVTLSVFNDTTTLLNLSSKIGDIKKLNNKNYRPDSLTALYDAIMITYNKMKHNIKKNDHFVALVLTDGMENSSKEYNNKDVQRLIKKVENRGGVFNFLCSDIDVNHYAESLDHQIDSNLCFFAKSFDVDLEEKLNDVTESVLNFSKQKSK